MNRNARRDAREVKHNPPLDGDDLITLAEALPLEMARVREVLGHYKEIGPAGMFGAAFIEQDLRKADQAVMSGDIVRMLQAYETLKGIES
jgi:hypothetical protein